LTKIMGNKAEYLLLHVIDTGLSIIWKIICAAPYTACLITASRPARKAIKAAEETAGKKTIEETLDAARNIGLNVSSSIKQADRRDYRSICPREAGLI